MTEAFTAMFPFGGLGAGALGFQRAQARLFGASARFEVLGGIDFDDLASQDFVCLTGAPSLTADIAQMKPADLVTFAGSRCPDVVFFSPPCKSASGLLSAKLATTPKYRAMGGLALTWTRLMLEAWPDGPALILLENVPRLKQREAGMLRKLRGLLRRAGYVLHDGYHDCGELGGLAQHRRRYLLVARHPQKCPPLLYQPPKRRVRGCGEVLGTLPMPEDPSAGPLHKLPNLSWLNWVRLALIPAGGDWRDLPGVLGDGEARRAKFRRHGVERWNAATGAVAGSGTNGVQNVADPRPAREWFGSVLGVKPWNEPSGVVTGNARAPTGAFSVADPRLPCANNPRAHHNKYRVESWVEPAHTVIGATRPGSGAPAVADPRVKRAFDHGYAVLHYDEPSPTVAGGSYPGQGAYSVADPRLECQPRAGAYGVLDWREAAGAITGHARADNGRFAVGDPRKPPPFLPVIIAEDGTWHRPLTILELAALQSIPTVVRGAPLRLAGNTVRGWRERIGNAVPVDAAEAIATQMLVALLQARLGTFALSAGDVWVRPDEFGART